jgi:phospholipase A1
MFMNSKNHKSRMMVRSACIQVAIILTGIFWTGPVQAGAGDYPLSGVDRRLLMEQVARDNPFLLLPHRPNYILPLAYWFEPNEEPFGLQPGSYDKMEMKFQVSLKLPISEDLFGGAGDLYAAYTNRSWWQTYNAQRSRPFRETNHEPELFLLYDVDIDMLGFTATNFVVGVSHQSNGQGGPCQEAGTGSTV